MDETTIARVMNNSSPSAKLMFKGTYPSNTSIPVPPFTDPPCGYIVNTSKSNTKGLHWISMYYKDDVLLYYDPLRNYVLDNVGIRLNIKRLNVKRILIMPRTQHNYSIACGFFATSFLIHMATGKNYKLFFSRFDDNFMQNDSLICAEMLHKYPFLPNLCPIY